VVAGGRAAGEHQFGDGDLRADVERLRRDARPDRIERLQPVEERRVLPGGEVARQVLEEVVMRVDQAGQDDRLPRVDDGVCLHRQRIRWPDLLDHVIPHEDRAVRPLGPGIVHRGEQRRVADQQGGHTGDSPFLSQEGAA